MADLRPLKREIHGACRQLGLDSDTRHALQLQATGKASMTEMGRADLLKLKDALKAKGYTPRPRAEKHAKNWRTKSPRPEIRKIHVLWRLLADAGVQQRGARALNAFINSTKFAAKWGHNPRDVDMLPGEMAMDVIEALKVICRRNGISVNK